MRFWILMMSKKKKYCRMCEKELLKNSEDGLCGSCHLQLCLNQDKCNRCFNLINKLIDFIKGDNEEEKENHE